MLNAPSRIDQLTIGDHHLITAADEIYYFGEYTARKGYSYSPTNQLIVNLKHGVEHRGTYRWRYKQGAIAEVAQSLARHIADNFAQEATFIPIPPSVIRTDASYDGRNADILRQFKAHKPHADVRELLYQIESTRKSHESDDRLTVDELTDIYRVDESLATPAPRTIVLFDDVLTTGTHFVAARQVLRKRFGDVRFMGVMVARRKPEPFDFSVFPALDDH
jgi:predicted amidophosphoribosyltransferase